MKHEIVNSTDSHPYEIIKVKIIAENKQEATSINKNDQILQNYLLFKLNTVQIIKMESPFFIIKRLKQKIGLG